MEAARKMRVGGPNAQEDPSLMRKRRRPDEQRPQDAEGQPQLWHDLMSAASDEMGSMDGIPAEQRMGMMVRGLQAVHQVHRQAPQIVRPRPLDAEQSDIPGEYPSADARPIVGTSVLPGPPSNGAMFGVVVPGQPLMPGSIPAAVTEMPEISVEPVALPALAHALELPTSSEATQGGEDVKPMAVDGQPPGSSWPLVPAATAVVADASELARYPLAQAQPATASYPQYTVTTQANQLLPYPSAIQTVSHYRAVVVPAPAEIMRQSVDSRTRVRCEPGTLGGRDEIVTSQKLWQKYGEKTVQHTRDKGADGRTNSNGKQKKRLYFKCYNKSCPAKMIVDIDLTTGEQLAPSLSGAHTHTFEIAPGEVEA